jgi:hypothetical protein
MNPRTSRSTGSNSPGGKVPVDEDVARNWRVEQPPRDNSRTLTWRLGCASECRSPGFAYGLFQSGKAAATWKLLVNDAVDAYALLFTSNLEHGKSVCDGKWRSASPSTLDKVLYRGSSSVAFAEAECLKKALARTQRTSSRSLLLNGRGVSVIFIKCSSVFLNDRTSSITRLFKNRR